MTIMPKVSIITATYNGEKFIERAIKSVLYQTFKDWEMIIVDDGSTDNTVKIIKEYSQKDPRIKLIELKQNSGGPAIPRTIACKESKGEYIAFLDQDDIYYPEYLELKVNYLEKHHDIDILSSLAWTFDEETKKIINYEIGGPVNTFIRKFVCEKGWYFKNYEIDEIGVIFRYFLLNNENFYKQKLLTFEPISLYSRHPQQSSYIENKDKDKLIKILQHYINEFNEYKLKNLGFSKNQDLAKYIIKFRKYWYSRLGNFYCLAGNLYKGRDAFKNSLKIGFNWFSLFFLLVSYLGFEPYRKIEYISRLIQRKLFWKIKVLFYKNKFRESYNKALKILQEL